MKKKLEPEDRLLIRLIATRDKAKGNVELFETALKEGRVIEGKEEDVRQIIKESKENLKTLNEMVEERKKEQKIRRQKERDFNKWYKENEKQIEKAERTLKEMRKRRRK